MATLIGTLSFAQSIAPQSINSGGAKLSQSNASMSFTVGELVVLTQTDVDGNALGTGFTAGSVSTVSIQDTDASLLDVKVFPNPATESVIIKINHATLEHFVVSISDLQGKEVFNRQYAINAKSIDLNTMLYPAGTYILALRNINNQILGTYKIIKQ
jgi:hypothetical protein